MNRIRLFPWELDSMPEYSNTLPSATTLWKIWRRNANDRYAGWLDPRKGPTWFVYQYAPAEDANRVRIKCFEVQLLEGPYPLAGYTPPDWSNYARWKRERALHAFPQHIDRHGRASS